MRNWLKRLIWTTEQEETRPELVGLRGGWQWTVPSTDGDSLPSVLPPLAPGELRRDIEATSAAMEELSDIGVEVDVTPQRGGTT
jgi:hypothetical protein